MDIEEITTERGVVFGINTPEGAARAFMPEALQDGPLARPASVLRDNVSSFMQDAQKLSARLLPSEVTKDLRLKLESLSPPFMALVNAAASERSAIKAADLAIMSVASGNDILKSDQRAGMLKLDTPSLITLLLRAPVATLAAAVEAGPAFFNLDDEVWERVCDRYRALNQIEKSGLSADFQRKPSLELLTASGVDEKALQAFAEHQVVVHHQRLDLVDACEHALQSLLPVLAVACNLSVDEVFAILVPSTK